MHLLALYAAWIVGVIVGFFLGSETKASRPELREDGPLETPLLYRENRGSLSESMATTIQYFSVFELKEHLIKLHIADRISAPPLKLECKYYGYDSRIGWSSYLISMNGYPVGFTNQLINFD